MKFFNTTGPVNWESPPENPALPETEAHIWRMSLAPPSGCMDEFLSLLCSEERSRADRFRFEKHRNRFIAARGGLRKILSGYLSVSPESVSFSTTDLGKPFTAGPAFIQFNLSHSGLMALYIFAAKAAVGIDLEMIKEKTRVTDLAGRYFFPSESGLIEKYPEHLRKELFFRYWTLKEACIKGTGQGLSGLESVEIGMGPDRMPVLLRIRGSRSEAKAWSLHPLDPAPGYVGAFCVEGSAGKYRFFSLDFK